eukprot:COSAG06_NODE_3680_length_5023_cov_11.389115_6_plen_110_part_00
MNYMSLEELEGMGPCASIETLSDENFVGKFPAAATTTDSSNTTVTAAVFTTMDCDDALAFAGFLPDVSLGKVLMWHLITNLFFRGMGFLGLKYLWTGRSCKQNCADGAC